MCSLTLRFHTCSDEVLWGNLPMRRTQRIARTLAMSAVFVAILIFYLPVTAAIQVGSLKSKGCEKCVYGGVLPRWCFEV